LKLASYNRNPKPGTPIPTPGGRYERSACTPSHDATCLPCAQLADPFGRVPTIASLYSSAPVVMVEGGVFDAGFLLSSRADGVVRLLLSVCKHNL
jgi:hypothetical protein